MTKEIFIDARLGWDWLCQMNKFSYRKVNQRGITTTAWLQDVDYVAPQIITFLVCLPLYTVITSEQGGSRFGSQGVIMVGVPYGHSRLLVFSCPPRNLGPTAAHYIRNAFLGQIQVRVWWHINNWVTTSLDQNPSHAPLLSPPLAANTDSSCQTPGLPESWSREYVSMCVWVCVPQGGEFVGSWYLSNWSDMHTNGSCFVSWVFMSEQNAQLSALCLQKINGSICELIDRLLDLFLGIHSM